MVIVDRLRKLWAWVCIGYWTGYPPITKPAAKFVPLSERRPYHDE